MEPATPLTPCQILSQAWSDYTHSETIVQKTKAYVEMIDLLKDHILGFRCADAPVLERMAQEMKATKEFDIDVSAKVNELADRLTNPSPLPMELWMSVIDFISPVQRLGISCTAKCYDALSWDPAYLAQSINTGAHQIPLQQLPALLAKCGTAVVELDLARLLSKEDRQSLNRVTLKRLVDLCPNLQSLTLFQVQGIKAGELFAVFSQAHARKLQHLNVAACDNMQQVLTMGSWTFSFYPSENSHVLERLVEHRVRLEYFLSLPEDVQQDVITSYSDICMLMDDGVSFRHYCELPKEKRGWVLQNKDAIRLISKLGMTLDTFCALPLKKQQLFAENYRQIDSLSLNKNFRIAALAELAIEELELVFKNTQSLKDMFSRGLDFIAFCRLHPETKAWLLSEDAPKLTPFITLERLLAMHPLLLDQIAKQSENLGVLLVNHFPLDLLLNLSWDTREQILQHAHTCVSFLKAAIPAETIVKLSLDTMKEIKERLGTLKLFLKSTDFLQNGVSLETILKLEDDEMYVIKENLQAFSQLNIPLERYVEQEKTLREEIFQKLSEDFLRKTTTD